MFKKIYYYSLQDIAGDTCFENVDCINFLKAIFSVESLSGYTVPSDLTTKKTLYDELISLVFSRFREHAIVKISKYQFQLDPTSEEIDYESQKWGMKFLAYLNDSHDFYITLLGLYADAKSKLMDDIKATSKNNVKFNDTPQNANTEGVYEGDNYITHFTHTEGETTSQLTSKIMRLKEIQDAYKDVMSDWVRGFERIFYTEEVEWNNE